MAEADEPFDFIKFKTKICLQGWVSGQATPLEMRLRLLESFLDIDKSSIPQLRESSRKPPRNGQKPTNGPSPSSPPSAPRKKLKVDNGTAWDFGPGSLTIVDLSCPFVDESDACALFNIVLNIFLDGRTAGGRIIALDEAHKVGFPNYTPKLPTNCQLTSTMFQFLKSGNVQAKNLTETMLSIIRQQRHLAARVIIATQEPTLAPSLLDLCNVTIVHRFSSPAWYKTLHGHLASAVGRNIGSKDDDEDIFAKVVRLKTGEALVFCPAAVLDGKLWCFGSKYWFESRDMGTRYFKMKVRHRVTADGGKSIMASN